MPHAKVPSIELTNRLSRLRLALSEKDANWRMIILDHKIDLYYFTGTMQDGALIITPQNAVYFVRRSYDTALNESLFADIRPMKSFRTIAEEFSDIPETVYVCVRTMTLQKLSLLQKYLPFAKTAAIDAIISDLRAVKSEYELDQMRTAGKMHAHVLEEIVPTLLQENMSEASLSSQTFQKLLEQGAMGIARFNQPFSEDVIGVTSFGENSTVASALDSPSGIIGTSIAMKSIGSSKRLLQKGDTLLLDIPSGFRGYHTDKSICFFFGNLSEHPQKELIKAAREQCVYIETEAAKLLKNGAVPSEIYEKTLKLVDPAFAESYMNGVKFLGHSVGLTIDETPVIARGFDTPLAANMTLAIEPKIALSGIGLIGTENTYEIRSEGAAISLTGNCDTLFEINK